MIVSGATELYKYRVSEFGLKKIILQLRALSLSVNQVTSLVYKYYKCFTKTATTAAL